MDHSPLRQPQSAASRVQVLHYLDPQSGSTHKRKERQVEPEQDPGKLFITSALKGS